MTERQLLDYDSVKQLAQALDRPVSTLLAQDPSSDPFFAGRLGRRAGAQWFAKLWRRFELGPGTHLRRVHYILVSQASPIIGANSKPYENTDDCWQNLIEASRDARYLGLVRIEDFEDRRNDGVAEYLVASEQDADLQVEEPFPLSADLSSLKLNSWLSNPPKFQFSPAVVDQRFHIELWAEKTSVNDVLMALAGQYGLNVVTASGEISLTHCHRLVERAKASAPRPVRILYISDFDPAGMSIPVACARKIEFLIHREHLDLDVQVRPVVLTHEQCVRYRLPRTPIKKSEARAKRFEQRFDKGGTELDALEALHPGELRRILEQEIQRYHDGDLDYRVSEAADDIQSDLNQVREAILQHHKTELDAVKAAHGDLVGQCNAELKQIADRYRKPLKKIAGRFNRLQKTIAEELESEAPDPAEMDWPEPDDGDEDEDPLFDSTRDYVEQANRFKEHQGKPTARRGKVAP